MRPAFLLLLLVLDTSPRGGYPDASKFVPLHTLEGHTNRVWDVAFHPSGSTLVSSGMDQTVRVWETADFIDLLLSRLERQEIPE